MTLTTQTPYCVVEESSGIIEHQRTTYYIKNLFYSKCSSPNRKKNIGLIDYCLHLPKHFVCIFISRNKKFKCFIVTSYL